MTSSYIPLAEKMRPQTLADFVGQEHLTGKKKIIDLMMHHSLLTSLILWGPPGSGKTTLARLIANQLTDNFFELSATNTTKAEILNIIKLAKQNHRLQQKTILFIDEIHRFNKAQQDTFLPFIEDGTIVLIGATTENPSYEVIGPLLSRCQVLTLQPLSQKNLINILERANNHKLNDQVINYLATIAGGDGRTALNDLETLLSSNIKKNDLVQAQQLIQKKPISYSKNGSDHYDLISAFIKSMRNSNPDATLYYLSRMIQAGEDPKFIARRMIIFASEDIGVAASSVVNLTVSTFLAVEKVGLPECRYNLFHCALILAKCQKSRLVSEVMDKAISAATIYDNLTVPDHLTNHPKTKSRLKTKSNDQLNHDLPTEIQDLKFLNSN